MFQSLRAGILDAVIDNDDKRIIKLSELMDQLKKLENQGLNIIGWDGFILMAKQYEINVDTTGSFLYALKLQAQVTEDRRFLNELNYLIAALELNNFEDLTISQVVNIYKRYKPDEISTKIKEINNIDITNPLEDLDLPFRIFKLLDGLKIKYIHQLTRLSQPDLIDIGLDKKQIQTIKSILKESGLKLEKDPNISSTNVEFLLEEGIINKPFSNFLKNRLEINDLRDLRKMKFNIVKNTFPKTKSGQNNFLELLRHMLTNKIHFTDKQLHEIQQLINEEM